VARQEVGGCQLEPMNSRVEPHNIEQIQKKEMQGSDTRSFMKLRRMSSSFFLD
jgi:hypothetical protein